MIRIIGVLLITFLLTGFTRGPEPDPSDEGKDLVSVFNNKRKRADRHFENSEYESAINLYEKLAHKGKADDIVKLRLAESYLELDDFANSEKWYAETIDSEQVTPNHQIQYAQVLLHNGKYDEAREVIGTYEFAESDSRSQYILNTLNTIEEPAPEEEFEEAAELSTISAFIIDENNVAINNASLKLMMNDQETETRVSDEKGNVSLQVAPDQEYTIIVEKEGFGERTISLPAESLGQQEDLLIVMNSAVPASGMSVEENLESESDLSMASEPEFPEWDEEYTESMHLVEADVIDAVTGNRLHQADLKLFVDSPNQEVEYELSEGVLTFEAKSGEDYIIVASHEDYQDRYISLSGNELLKSGSGKLSLELSQYNNVDKSGRSSSKFKTLVYDNETGEQLEDAEVKFFVDGRAIESEFSKENGKTVFKSPKGKDYMMMASRIGYQDLIYHLPGAPEENMDVDLALLKEQTSGMTKYLTLKGYAIDEFSGADLQGVTFKVFENGDLIESTQVLSFLEIHPGKDYQVLAMKEGYAESLQTINTTQSVEDEPIALPFALSEEKISEATGRPVYQEIAGDVMTVDANIFDITDDQPLSEALVSVFADDRLQEKTRSWQGKVTVNTSPGIDYHLVVEREGYNDRIIDLNRVTGSEEINIALIPQNMQRLGLSDMNLVNGDLLVMAGPGGEDQLYLSTDDALYRYATANHNQYLISEDRIILLEENASSVPSVENLNRVLSENNINVSEIFNVNSIYYDFDKAEIREDAAIELDKLAAIMSSNENIKVTMFSHTDSRGSSSYNKDLSGRRGMAAVKYLTDKGIDVERLTVDAKGESQLINSCTGNSKCSEEAHQLNRRTEFILSI